MTLWDTLVGSLPVVVGGVAFCSILYMVYFLYPILLGHVIPFTQANMAVPDQCKMIFDMALKHANHADPDVAVPSINCVSEIATNHYSTLGDTAPGADSAYIQRVFNILVPALSNDEEDTALCAANFWCLLARHELLLRLEAEELGSENIPAGRVSRHFVMGALDWLFEPLLKCLLQQEDEQTPESWNMAIAAQTCLREFARCCGDEIARRVLPFVMANLQDADWHKREAAVAAFAVILDGPNWQQNAADLNRFVEFLCTRIQSLGGCHPLEKQTIAWALAQVCECQVGLVRSQNLVSKVVDACSILLGTGVAEAEQGCWALRALAEACQEDANINNGQHELAPILQPVLTRLIAVAEGDISHKGQRLQFAAYSTVAQLVLCCPASLFSMLAEMVQFLCGKLDTLSPRIAQLTLANDPNSLEEPFFTQLEELICSSLQYILTRIGTDGLPGATQPASYWLSQMLGGVNNTLLNVLKRNPKPTKNTTLQACSTVGAMVSLASLVSESTGGVDVSSLVAQYIDVVLPYLDDPDQFDVYGIVAGVLADFARALGPERLITGASDFVTRLCRCYQHPDLLLDCRAPIISALADILSELEDKGVQFLPAVMQVYQHASSIVPINGEDIDEIDEVQNIRRSTLSGYSQIINAFLDMGGRGPMTDHIAAIMTFCKNSTEDELSTTGVVIAGVGLLADIAVYYKAVFEQYIQGQDARMWLTKLMNAAREDAQEVEDGPSVMQYAGPVLRRYTL
ncbi:hypothetical protein KIPB_006542 [Kipferlia bialata]|uniref:Importin subunit beta-1/Transportin-1-like TPR repeats domain-containing protein n=1 Tax=Kipferlia bialata TaxID=797122 RepID=A0A9K3CYR1_9EUKA|nr:hypothetical protein KIPB_006542 [Kipferlia bialata]|eukprot:g6542.t1